MAESYGFFDGGQLYGQDEFNRYFSNMFENGVSIDSDGTMTMSSYVSENNIIVGAGFAIINGFFLYNDSNKTISITRDSNCTRKDRIVLRLDLSNKKISIELKSGTASSNPEPPTLTRNNLVYELSIYQVNVPVSGNITLTDERFRTDLCGAIRPKNLTEYNNMVKQFQNNFDKWFDNLQGQAWRNIYIQNNQPSSSVVGTIWIKELT